MKNNAIVIGTGISGLSVSKMLGTNYNVKVLEKADKIGGLIKCARIDGNLFHLVGGHVFNSKKQEVLDWFWNNFDRDTEFLKAIRNAKILMGGEVIGYPIENFIYQLPDDLIKKIVKDLLQIAKQDINPQHSDNFELFLKQSFGQTLYDTYFGPYNTKIWNTDLKDVPLEWLEGKLPMPNIEDTLLSNILKKEEAGMVHATFYYPVRNGSQFIIDRIATGLDITTSYTVSSIKHEGSKVVVNDGDYMADTLVYCGDVRQLYSIVKIKDDKLMMALNNIQKVKSNGTSNVLCETDANDISWLYLPENKFKAHRIIYTGNFSDTNNEGTDRRTCVVEFSGKHHRELMIKELALLPGNLKPLAFNYEPNSYIIHNKTTKKDLENVKATLKIYNIHLLGRFAEWEYYNMDKCIESAMELSSQLNLVSN